MDDFDDDYDTPSANFDVFNHALELAPIDNRPARRLSMEEDYFYEQVMTFAQPPNPPAYHVATHGAYEGPSRKGKEAVLDDNISTDQEMLPDYYCDVHMETVFQMKMEIEDAVKRAEYRNWRSVVVVLHGTALHIFSAKKTDFGWGKSRMHGPDVRPDNPSWLRKGSLERKYSLQHADVGIAADYHKYVTSCTPFSITLDLRSGFALCHLQTSHTHTPARPSSLFVRSHTTNIRLQASLCHPHKGRDRSVSHFMY